MIERGIDKKDIILLFTDTKIEDEDLYKFLDETTKRLGIPLTNYSDGRDIWQVFRDSRFLGNSRADPCSEDLKRKMSRKFIQQFYPKNCIIYLGFDWSEINRYEKAKKAWLPYRIECPLIDKPYLGKEDMKLILANEGIPLPKLYRLGFAHNNCGGGCVKAGIGHFVHLLDALPNVFNDWEKHEQGMRDYLNQDVSILSRIKNGVPYNLTLKQLREERMGLTEDELCDIGGCNCFQE